MDGSSRFDGFTEQAMMVMNRAEAEARRFQHSYIGTEHLLLGLLQQREGIAAKTLVHLGVDLDKVRDAVEFIIGRGDRVVLGAIGLTPRAAKIIELAQDCARCLSDHSIGTEHLLLGLVLEGEGIAAGVLESLGVNLEKVRIQTLLDLNQSDTAQEKEAKSSATPPIDQIGTDLAAAASADKRQSDTAQEEEAKSSATPIIDQVSHDLIAWVRTGLHPPVSGRHQEIEQVMQILSRQNKNNPLLIGAPGIGKTSIVNGFAQRMIAGSVPETLSGKRLLRLDVGSLVGFAEDLKKWLADIGKKRDCILVMNKVHTLASADMPPGVVAVATLLRSALVRGQLQCIGMTTLDEYRKYIEGDAALQRCFQAVIVHELTVEETVEVLKGTREYYERCHCLIITDEALLAAARMASRYIPARLMPEKAISLINEAALSIRRPDSLPRLNLEEAKKALEAVQREKEAAREQQDHRRVAVLCDREVKLRDRIARLEAGWRPIVGEEEITCIISRIIFAD